jgi:hypothetical protein
VIREDRFLISRKPYAVDLSTLSGKQHERGDRIAFSGSVNAVWFRRQGGVTRACIGSLKLWSHYLPAPLDLDDPHAVLSADLDGRYGGNCQGRWDGIGYWGAEDLDVQAQYLAILRPMLASYPVIPAAYDGWWRF